MAFLGCYVKNENHIQTHEEFVEERVFISDLFITQIKS